MRSIILLLLCRRSTVLFPNSETSSNFVRRLKAATSAKRLCVTKSHVQSAVRTSRASTTRWVARVSHRVGPATGDGPIKSGPRHAKPFGYAQPGGSTAVWAGFWGRGSAFIPRSRAFSVAILRSHLRFLLLLDSGGLMMVVCVLFWCSLPLFFDVCFASVLCNFHGESC